MSTIQNVLVATDFSESAHVAVQRAALLAAVHGARLRLLHVMQSDAIDELLERLRVKVDVRRRLLEDAESQLASLAEELHGALGSSPEHDVRIGRVADEVLAASDYADILVVGARGVTRARDIILGTTAERLLSRNRRPMLVVRGEAERPYGKVLVPVDFSIHSMAALRFARKLAPDAYLQVFHAYENPYEGKLIQADVSDEAIEAFRLECRNQALANMAGFIDRTLPGDLRVSSSIDRGDAKFLIAAEAVRHGADLIVIGKRGRSGVEEFFLGGVTRATLTRASCDVAVVPEHPRL